MEATHDDGVRSTTNLADAESTLQTLEAKAEDSAAFSALEETTSESVLDGDTNEDRSVKSNYCSSHNTSKEWGEEALEQPPPALVETSIQTLLVEVANLWKLPYKCYRGREHGVMK